MIDIVKRVQNLAAFLCLSLTTPGEGKEEDGSTGHWLSYGVQVLGTEDCGFSCMSFMLQLIRKEFDM